jgi:hypothetical protein
VLQLLRRLVERTCRLHNLAEAAVSLNVLPVAACLISRSARWTISHDRQYVDSLLSLGPRSGERSYRVSRELSYRVSGERSLHASGERSTPTKFRQ